MVDILKFKGPLICLLACLLLFKGLPSFAFSNAFDEATLEPKAKSWKEDWLLPLRTSKKTNVVQEVSNHPLHVRISSEDKAYKLELLPDANNLSNTIEFLPNAPGFVAVSITDSKSFGFSFSTTSGEPQNEITYGHTHARDFRLEIPFEEWQLMAFYANYRGFYVENTNAVLRKTATEKIKLPNMEAETFGLTATFVATPHRFSLPALINQTARQTKSGGSWIAGFSIKQQNIENDGAFAVSAQATSIATGGHAVSLLKKIDTTSYTPRIGGGYQFNFTENVFLSGLMLIGVGYAHATLEGADGKRSYDETISDSLIQLSLGYNGLKYYYGTRVNYENTSVEVKNSSIDTELQMVSLYFGTRF